MTNNVTFVALLAIEEANGGTRIFTLVADAMFDAKTSKPLCMYCSPTFYLLFYHKMIH